MRYAASYAIVIGFLMLIQWSFFILTGNVPELQSEPIRISFHLAAEFLTAMLLIVSGIAVRRNKLLYKPMLFVAFGMLFYTVIVSPGYFAQQNHWVFVVMFGVIFVLALAAVYQLVRAT